MHTVRVTQVSNRGRTRATMKAATCVRAPPERVGEPAEPPSCQGSGLVILTHHIREDTYKTYPNLIYKQNNYYFLGQ